MVDDLVRPVSKRLFFLLLIVTVGSELALFLSRYSSFFTEIYDAIMIVSIFVAWKLHPRLAGPTGRKAAGTLKDALGFTTDMPDSKHKFWNRGYASQFAAAFLLFYMGSAVVNFYSTILFPGFNDQYEEYVEESVEAVNGEWNQVGEEEGLIEPGATNSLIDWFEFEGYDFYTSALAGFEEVYRLGYIILILMLFKKILPNRWSKWPKDVFLMAALFISSLLFGVGHALDTPQPWEVTIGTVVTFTNLGLFLGILLLWSRNLWLLIAVHGVYDIVITFEWYYFEYASLLFSGLLLTVWIMETAVRKIGADSGTEMNIGE
ncbi:hypothetical protein A8F94_21330 [Bacillus sp. FJAT-27225]|uniref:CPBP family glutamic-type intramembrane protease n=1 Tax=Bacillus sp. FJAT-27225 TaxID=1743144 RepID=UPI00080C221A|nr:CPBP family glutamic-type intramembrane protease [Bacillus sp. FJAT-27225]OCA82447.1 hypothetical protein A8F94_21330 [Bacillus sp. FJAT-27225]